MTEKRFKVVMNEFDEVEYIMDKVAMEDRDFAEFIEFVEDVCKENKQLKLENGEMEDYLGRLEEVNEQLKQELKELNKKYIAFSEATDKRLKELMVMDE